MTAIMACFVLMLALQLITPFWWWIMVVPFVYGVWKSRSVWESARVGMISAGALWFAMVMWQWLSGGQQLAERVSKMLGMSSVALMFVLTVAVAVLAAGMAGVGGYFLKPFGRIIENRGGGGVRS